MRLWHYQLLPYLPRLQLISQWRECCCIAKSITEKGTPNHILVNKIMDCPIDHFVEYCCYVCIEMEHRGYRCDFSRLDRYLEAMNGVPLKNGEQIFPEWHNDIYLRECLYNLEEKALYQGIPADEWLTELKQWHRVYGVCPSYEMCIPECKEGYNAQIAEYKRLLKSAIDEWHIVCEWGDCGEYCSWYENGKCTQEWSNKAEALKLIGDEPNGI